MLCCVLCLDKSKAKNKVQVDEPLIEAVIEQAIESLSSPAEPADGEPAGPKSDKSDDEILDAVIKTATTPSGRTPRDNRRRSRNGLRKSCKFTPCIYCV